MEASFVHLLLLCLLGFCTDAVSSQQSDSCSTALPVAHLIPFNTSSLHCSPAWTQEDFILRYGKTGASQWSYVLSAPDAGSYVAVGFSSDGSMVGSSAVVGWVSKSGTGAVKQYYLGGKSPDACAPDKGALALVKDRAAVVRQSSRLYLAFQISAQQPTTHLLYAVGPKGALPSANAVLPEHRDMASRSVNSSSGVASDAGASRPAFPPERRHGLLAMLGWGMLMPIGAMAARYFRRQDPHWFYAHILIQGAAFALGVAGIALGFRLSADGIRNVATHRALGIAILVLGSLQVMAILARPGKTSKVRKYWNWYHHSIGRLAIACAIANVFFGLSVAQEVRAYAVSYGVFAGVWFVAVAAFEINRCRHVDD